MSCELLKSKHILDFIRSLDNPLLDMDYHPGHARLLKLLRFYHLPKPKLRFRIAGTNGKGSTGHFLEKMLVAHGYRVGFYTSPHIFRFNERVRIDGKAASDEMLVPLLEKLIPLGKQVGTSPFELATALSLIAFESAQVDIQILECGLGAKLDASTAVSADIGLITPIGLDHQAWLGETLTEIAEDKAYALHGCKWGLSSSDQTDEVLTVLKAHHANLQVAQKCPEPLLNILPDSFPVFQKDNVALAYTALVQLHKDGVLHLEEAKMNAAILTAQPQGRLQHVQFGDANIWLDAAHNCHAVKAILPCLPKLVQSFDAILIYTRADRSLQDCIHLLRPFGGEIISATCENIDVSQANVEGALAYVLNKKPSASVLLLGSFISVAAGLKWLEVAE